MLLGIYGKEMAIFTGMDGLIYVPILSCSREEVKQLADTGRCWKARFPLREGLLSRRLSKLTVSSSIRRYGLGTLFLELSFVMVV